MDVMRRPDINGPWRVWRRKTVRLAVSLLLVLSLAVSGGVWWYRRTHPAGPAEPMCLLIMAEDVRPIVGEPTRVLEGYSSYPSVVAGGYWTCAIYGGETREIGIDFEVTPDADEHLLNYRSIRTPVIETLLEYRGGVSEPVPNTDAVLISWVQGGEAFVGWFEGDSAVVVSTLFIYDNRTAIGYLDDLAAIVKRYAPQLLAITGFGPSPTPSSSPPAAGSSEPASSPPPPTSSPDEQTDGADG